MSQARRRKQLQQRFYLPGDTQLILISWFSFAAVLVKAITAALLAQYAALPGAPNWPKTLAADTWASCQNLSQQNVGINIGVLTILPPGFIALI